MHTKTLQRWQHTHIFGQDKTKKAEKYTIIVIVITAITMIVEIATGILFGSMALLADGLHMGTHALALGIAAFAYYYTRKHADDARYSFGTGKVNSLGGFASALLLAVFALLMVWESVERLITPVTILFNQAIGVAVIGLMVNVICAVILSKPHSAHEHHHHDHDSGHSHHHDHNLRAAYLHVIADALTSVFAIIALLAGKFWGWMWMDPFMGIVGAIMISRWAWGLMRETCKVLLDRQAPGELRESIRNGIENQNTDRVADLHVWCIGPNLYAVNMSLVTDNPQPPDYYKSLLPKDKGIVHVTMEIQRCQ